MRGFAPAATMLLVSDEEMWLKASASEDVAGGRTGGGGIIGGGGIMEGGGMEGDAAGCWSSDEAAEDSAVPLGPLSAIPLCAVPLCLRFIVSGLMNEAMAPPACAMRTSRCSQSGSSSPMATAYTVSCAPREAARRRTTAGAESISCL